MEPTGLVKERPVHKPAVVLSELEEATLKSLEKGMLPLDELTERVDEVRKLVAEGLARLAVSQYVWGVEMQVELTERGFEYIHDENCAAVPRSIKKEVNK